MIPANLTILDFYRVCRNGVRLFPATVPAKTCLQLNAWRVLQRDPRLMLEIGTDTLGAVPTDKDTPFFWSRLWEQRKFDPGALGYTYPLMTAFEIVNETNGNGHPFDGNTSRQYTVELAVLDVFKPDACKTPNPGACDGRPVNQIFLDTELLLDSMLRYIGGTVIGTTTANPTPMVYNRMYLETLPGHNITMDIGAVWKSKNTKLVFSRVEYVAKNIYGTKCRFTFVADKCPTIQFNPSIADPKLIGFEAGCSNC